MRKILKIISQVSFLKLDIFLKNVLLELVRRAGGFDLYILKTPPCELNSVFGNLLKRDMLRTLADDDWENTMCKSEKEFQLLKETKYKDFEVPRSQIEWIGLPLSLALQKQYDIEVARGNPRYTSNKPLIKMFEEQIENGSFESDYD